MFKVFGNILHKRHLTKIRCFKIVLQSSKFWDHVTGVMVLKSITWSAWRADLQKSSMTFRLKSSSMQQKKCDIPKNNRNIFGCKNDAAAIDYKTTKVNYDKSNGSDLEHFGFWCQMRKKSMTQKSHKGTEERKLLMARSSELSIEFGDESWKYNER